MLSSVDLERLINEKRLDIEKEKKDLGVTTTANTSDKNDDKENKHATVKKLVNISNKTVRVQDVVTDNNIASEDNYEDTENIPPDLERYIRRYLGLPVMLKAGEFSPNNPLIRAERHAGDALLGLGEYERRRNTLRKIQQKQYKEYLDQQAKKKQEAKEQAERERREREQREREREETERLREEREREELERVRRERERRSPIRNEGAQNVHSWRFSNKVDTGVQVDGVGTPLSVAVQTDEAELYGFPSVFKSQLTQAERELSPRTVQADDRPIIPVVREKKIESKIKEERRKSYGDFEERTPSVWNKSNREKLVSELRHSYMPSILDADAIQRRNVEAEKDAAERKLFYQQELKTQIEEQQRIKEERKAREKMLEQAEMRRLEEQLRMLRLAQDRELNTQRCMDDSVKDHCREFDKNRTELQKDIDVQKVLLRGKTQPPIIATQHHIKKRNATSYSESTNHKDAPNFQTKQSEAKEDVFYGKRRPFSLNIPENSIFNPNYDVDKYLRKNLNPSRVILENKFDFSSKISKNNIVEKAMIHEEPKLKYQPSFLKKDVDLPIPVLRHSPNLTKIGAGDNEVSDKMKIVEDKWKVPIVQKNIFKPAGDGKNLSILTQLGSIRRQLQMEQLKLDNMVPNK